MNFEEMYRGKTIVVSGASGYVAGALIDALACFAVKIVRLSRSSLPPLDGRVAYRDLQGDYADPAFWRAALPKADIIFHLASQTSFYKAAQDPEADFIANVVPMRAILETCRKEGCRPFVVFAGSATQAGLPRHLPVNESHSDEPVTIYDLHKMAAESLLEGYVRLGLARGTTLRLANVYGPGTRSSSVDRGILNAMIARGLHGEQLTVYGDGRPVRDYIYIDDIVAAFVAAGCGNAALNGRHFVMSSGRGVSLAEAFHLVGSRIAAMTGLKVPVVFVPEPAGQSIIESRQFVGDSSAFMRAAGWAPSVKLEEGIDRTIEYIRGVQPLQ